MEQNLEYNSTKLKELCKHNRVRQIHLMRLFNQTNSNTAKRWLEGKPIYFDTLLKICRTFDFDFLSFIKYKGHNFKTKSEDLYRLEMAGFSIPDILIEKSIAPSLSDQPVDEIQEWHKSQRREAVNSYNQMTEKSLTSIIDIVLKVQRECFEHELKSLEQLQGTLQAKIDELHSIAREIRNN